MSRSPRNIAQFLAFILPLVSAPLTPSAENASTSTSPTNNKETASISGTVVRTGTGEPLKKAHITLRPKNNEDDPGRAATTAADGKFLLDRVPPGTYELRVEHDGYMPKSYGEDDAGHGAAVLTLLSGHKIADLIFRLETYAVVSGRVTDEDGDPVRQTTVSVQKRTLHKGKMTLEHAGGSGTNDLGEYRIYDVAPGHCVISATPGGHRIQTSRPHQSDDSLPNYTTTYYPSAPTISRASEIELRAGDELSSMDISLVRVQTYSVRGRVTDLSGSNVRPFDWIVVTPEGAPESTEVRGISDLKDGTFELVGLMPGNYSLTVQGADETGQTVAGRTRLVISNANIDSVNVVIGGGVTIRGKIAIEGKSELPPLTYVWLSPKKSETDGHQARVAKDGTFELRQVNDGTYEIQATTHANDCYLKSARVRGVDVLENGLEISGGARACSSFSSAVVPPQ